MLKLDLKRLKAERIASGLSQEEVAGKFGKTRAWYAKRENGFVPVGADELASLAAMFNVGRENMGIFFTDNVPERERNSLR